ncbi:MAG: hypothetical protein AAF899_07835 [Pseudomonadota bacterium]
MKIESNTPQRLVLRDRPILMPCALLGGSVSCLYGVLAPEAGQTVLITTLMVLVSAAMGLAAWWYAPWQRIVFDRSAGEVIHHVHRLGRHSTHRMPLQAIHRIRHESHMNDSSRSYRLVLETAGGAWPLSAIFTGGRHDETETAIREWLTRPD